MINRNAKIVWTSDAVATLRNRDRFRQVNMLMEFVNLIAGKLSHFEKVTKCIDDRERCYVTAVDAGTHMIFWKYFQENNRVEVLAIGDKMLSSVIEVDELINSEGLKSCF